MRTIIAIAAATIWVGGCAETPAETVEPETFLRALLAGSGNTSQHDGDARYGSGGHPTNQEVHALIVSSRDPELGTEVDIEGIGPARMSVGTHSLEPLDRSDRDVSSGHTFWFELDGDYYVAESGHVTITRATNVNDQALGVIEGEFEGVAVYWSTGTYKPLPESFPASAPRLSVRGSFLARPHEEVPILLDQ